MSVTPRLSLRYPILSDTADVPRDVGNLANDIDDAAIFGAGTLAARPASASGTPGIAGRLYHATDGGVSVGHLWFDYGSGYREVALLDTTSGLTIPGNFTASGAISITSSSGFFSARSAATSGNVIMASRASADTVDRFQVYASGTMQWGPGGATVSDTTLSRTGVGQLSLGTSTQSGNLKIFTDNLGTTILSSYVTTDANPMYYVLGSGTQRWGAGGATAFDTMLSRVGSAQLRLTGNGTKVAQFQIDAGGSGTNGVELDFVPRDAGASNATPYIFVNPPLTSPYMQFTYPYANGWFRFTSGSPATEMARITAAGGYMSYTSAAQYHAQTYLTTADANPTHRVRGDGQLSWGPGGATAPDTNLYRSSVGVLKTDNSFVVGSSAQIQNNLTVDLGNTGSKLYFGSALDTNLYRSSAAALQTDGNLISKGYFYSQQATANTAFLTTVAGDSVGRFTIDSNGRMSWGTGAVATDTNLYRQSTGALATDNAFRVGQNVYLIGGTSNLQFNAQTAANYIFASYRSGEANARFAIREDGNLEWGAGGVSARDTNLYRYTAGQLRTDNSFLANGFITAGAGSGTDIYLGAGVIKWYGSSGDTNLYRGGADVLASDDTIRSYAALQTGLASDTVMRFSVDTGGSIGWGAGGVSARDTNLYRYGANQLKTDAKFYANGDSYHPVPQALFGTNSGGAGYTVVHNSTGYWTVTLTNGFTTLPVIFVSVDATITTAIPMVHPISNTVFDVRLQLPSGALADLAWNFVAIAN